jgi:hypothetical protein
VSNALEQLIAAGGVTIAQRKLMAMEGLSINMLISLYRSGELDTLVIGGRLRRIVLRSYVEYLQRQQRGLVRDESERRAAIENYRRSLSTQGAANAARARTGITMETRARGRRKAAALHEEPRRLAPRHPKSSLNKSQSLTKENPPNL